MSQIQHSSHWKQAIYSQDCDCEDQQVLVGPVLVTRLVEKTLQGSCMLVKKAQVTDQYDHQEKALPYSILCLVYRKDKKYVTFSKSNAGAFFLLPQNALWGTCSHEPY